MIRFSTVAANADFLGEDTPLAGEPTAPAVTPRTAERPEHRRGRTRTKGSDAGKPGKDINAPGLIKDGEDNKPS